MSSSLSSIRDFRIWAIEAPAWYDITSSVPRLAALNIRLNTSLGSRPIIWPTTPKGAVCIADGSSHVLRTGVPVEECYCGWYGFSLRALEDAVKGRKYSKREVKGVAEYWGKIVVHAEGVRAEFAKPVALLDEGQENLQAMAGLYGAKVVNTMKELEALVTMLTYS